MMATNGSQPDAFPSIDQAVEALEAAKPGDVPFGLGYQHPNSQGNQGNQDAQPARYRPASFVLEETDLDDGLFGATSPVRKEVVVEEPPLSHSTPQGAFGAVKKEVEENVVPVGPPEQAETEGKSEGTEKQSSEDDAKEMPPPHVAAILTCKEALLSDLNGKKVTESMLKRGLISEETAAEISSKKSKLNRNKKLLQALKHSDEGVFIGFCEVLRNEGKHPELADTLNETFVQFQQANQGTEAQESVTEEVEETVTETKTQYETALDDIPSIDIETDEASPRISQASPRDSVTDIDKASPRAPSIPSAADHTSPPTDVWIKTRALKVKQARDAFFSDDARSTSSAEAPLSPTISEAEVPPPPPVPSVPPPDEPEDFPTPPPSLAASRPTSTEIQSDVVKTSGTVTRRISFKELQAEEVAVDDDDEGDTQTDTVQRRTSFVEMKAENVSINSTGSQEVDSELQVREEPTRDVPRDDDYHDTVKQQAGIAKHGATGGAQPTEPQQPEVPKESAAAQDVEDGQQEIPPHVLAILACKQQLLEDFDAKKLTDQLLNRKILDEAAAQEIKSRKSKLNRNKKLLQFLRGSDEKVFLSFCNVLRYDCGLEELSGQLMAAYSQKPAVEDPAAVEPEVLEDSVLQEPSTGMQPGTSMDSLDVGSTEHLAEDVTKYEPHVKTILASKEMLLNELDSKGLVAELVNQGAMTAEMGESITSKKSKVNRNKRLLQYLKKEDENTFQVFCGILRAKPKTQNIAEILESTLYYHKIQGESDAPDFSDQSANETVLAAGTGLERTASDLSLSSAPNHEPHIIALITHKEMLYQDIDAKKLLGNLQSGGHLTQPQADEILSKKSKVNRNKKLLQCLRNNDVAAFNGFCESLRANGKGDIADQLVATMAENERRITRAGSISSMVSDVSVGSTSQMEPHVAAILACKETLLNDVDAKKLVDAMKARQCLDEAAAGEILARKSKLNRNKKMLQYLKQTDEGGFSRFLDVLREHKKGDVAEMLSQSWADYHQLEEQSRKVNLQRAASDASIVSDVSATPPTQCPPYLAALLVNKDLLLNDLDMKVVVSPMLERGYITEEAASGVLTRKTKLNRNKKMLQLLKNGDERLFNGFCDTLRSENQHKIADELAKAWYQYEMQEEEKTQDLQVPSTSLARTESQHSIQSDVSTTSLSDKPAHVATILTCREMLLNDIDAKKIVGSMVEQGTLEESVMTAVVERKTKLNRNKMLVQALKNGDERMFNGFCDALRGQKKYTKVAEALEQTFMNVQLQRSNSEPDVAQASVVSQAMTKATSETSITSDMDDTSNLAPHVRTILSCKDTLLKDMDAKVIVEAMQQRGVVSTPMAEGVTSRKSKLNRNKKLLQLLKHADENTFKTFCDVLKQEGSLPIIAEMLESQLYYNQLQGESRPLDDDDIEIQPMQIKPVLTRTLSDLSDTSGVSLASATPFSNQPPPALAILTCKDELVEKLDAAVILNDMVAAGAIDEGVTTQVTSRKSKVNRNKKLLQIMKQADDHTFLGFCAAVRRAGQEKLAMSLEMSFEHYKSVNVHADEVFNPLDVTNDSRDISFDMGSVSMDQRQGGSPVFGQGPHLVVLAMHRESLMADFDAKKVIKPLISRCKISEEDSQDVLNRKSKHNRNKKLLQLLKRMPEETFVRFCEVLAKEGKAPSLAQTLLTSLQDVKAGNVVVEGGDEGEDGGAENGQEKAAEEHVQVQPTKVEEHVDVSAVPRRKRSSSRDSNQRVTVIETTQTAESREGRPMTKPSIETEITPAVEPQKPQESLKPKPKKRQKSKSPARAKSKDRSSQENMAVAQSKLPDDIEVQHEGGTIKLTVSTPVIIEDNVQPSFPTLEPKPAVQTTEVAQPETAKVTPAVTRTEVQAEIQQAASVSSIPEGTLSRTESEDMLGQPPHVMAILATKNDLLQGMDAKYVIGPMMNRGIADANIAGQVTSRKSILNRNKKLLQILRNADEATFHEFCIVLKDEAGLPHLAKKLRDCFEQYAAAESQEAPQPQQQDDNQQDQAQQDEAQASSVPPGTPPHVAALLSSKELLLSEIDSKKLMPHLVEQRIVAEPASHEILARKSKLNRNKLLFQVLKAADDRTFRNFCDVLRYDGGKQGVADALERVYQQYLPPQMSEEQAEQVVQASAEENIPIGVTLWRGRSAETLL